MITSFRGQGTEDVCDGLDTRAARGVCPPTTWKVARRKLDQLEAAYALLDLVAPPGNRLEALKGDRKGEYSIRVNDQYRVCFVWTDDSPEQVEIVNYH